jgi:hypothetical protein
MVKRRMCANEGGSEKMLDRMTSNRDVLPVTNGIAKA